MGRVLAVRCVERLPMILEKGFTRDNVVVS